MDVGPTGVEMVVERGWQVAAECFNDISVLETGDPCPEECGGRGSCIEGLYCQCTACHTETVSNKDAGDRPFHAIITHYKL